MEPIRILHEVTCMNTGGLETLLMNIYRNIDREKVQFDFLTQRQEEGFYDKEIIQLGGKIYKGIRFNPFHIKKYYTNISNILKGHPEYKILHSHSTLGMFALKQAKKFNIVVRIIHCHNPRSSINYKLPFRIYCKYNNLKYATDMFSCSKSAAEYLFGKRNVEKTIILKNGIDTFKFLFDKNKRNKIRQEYGIEDKFVIGHVGRFSESKNHSFLIDVFNEYLKINSNSVLLLIGEGKLQEHMKSKVKKLKIDDKVIFSGVHSNIEDFYMAMDCFLFPSKYEGFGNVVIEAEATGLPCIISNKVPSDVEITNLVKKISLKKLQNWVYEIKSKEEKVKDRTIYYKQVAEAGYDIKEVAKFLEGYYIEKFTKGL